MSRGRGSWESVVSAASAHEAVEIAAEALPKGATIVEVIARDIARSEGANSWSVLIKFRRLDADDPMA